MLCYHFRSNRDSHTLRSLANYGGGTYEYFNSKTKSNWQSKVNNKWNFFSCKIEVFIVMIGSNIFEILMKWELPVYHQMKLFVSDLKTIANLFL